MLQTRGLFSLAKAIPEFFPRSSFFHAKSVHRASNKINSSGIIPHVPKSRYPYQELPLAFLKKRAYSSITAPNGTENNESKSTEGRLAIRFTCKVCNHINTKTMSKLAYEKGVVLIQCDGCENRHLIADNLGWFRDSRVNIEDLARENGEKIKRVSSDDPLLKGLFEFDPNSSK